MENENQKQNNTRQQRIENFLLNPDKEIFNSLEEFNESIKYIQTLLGNLDLNELEKIQGQDGKTPELGVDYLTDEDLDKIEAFIQDRISVSWSGYPTKEEINSQIQNKVSSEVAKIPRVKGDKGESGKDGKNGSPDTAEQILEKLRSLPKNKRINVSDIRGLQTELNKIAQDSETSIEDIRKLVNSFQVTIPALGSGTSDIDGLIEEGTNITITGSGTVADPFVINATAYTLPVASASVLGGVKKGDRISIDANGVISADVQAGGDEKVKYDAGDPTAGYVADKVVAGTGISVAEGTGANENKLVVTNSAPDQTVAITAGTNIDSVSGTYPNFTINASTQTTDISGKVDKSTFDANTILYATTDDTPVALTVGEQTIVGRKTGGNIEALAIDSDLSSVSASDDTVPSAKATKAALDAKAPLASPTFTGTITLADNCRIDLTLPTADTYCTGNTTDSFASGYSSAIGDLVFFGSGGKWLEVDADAVATCKGLMGIALEAKTDTQAMKVALPGSMVRLDSWNWTVGDTLYAGETLGALQNTIPTGADAIIKVVGFAVSADVIYFNPSPDQQSTVA